MLSSFLINSGLEGRNDLETFFDIIEVDEKRSLEIQVENFLF